MANNKNTDEPIRNAFAPPAPPVHVYCLHCGSCYISDEIVWKQGVNSPITKGNWCCPVDGCDGTGFGCDILPDHAKRFSQP